MEKWILAWHLIAMVAWFAALFYLPRLFVYHAACKDQAGHERFVVMERRLYRGIMWPAGIATTLLGIVLFAYHPHTYFALGWMRFKLAAVAVLWGFHLYCGYCRANFAKQRNRHSEVFYRFFNEVPTIILISVIIAAIVQP